MVKQRASHIWLGGAPCSGKSLIAAVLAHERGLAAYHADNLFDQHAANATPDSTLHRIHGWSFEKIFMRSPERMLADFVQVGREEFPMILQDLQAPEWRDGAVVEGCALLPESLASIGREGRCAVFLVATEQFQREHYARREWVQDVLQQTSAPAKAWDNWRIRDARFGQHVAAEAERFGFPVVQVDISRGLAEVTEEVRRLVAKAGSGRQPSA